MFTSSFSNLIAQTPEIYFSHTVKPYDTLNYDNSLRIFNDSLLQITFEFEWYGEKYQKINFGPLGFLLPSCTSGSITGENFTVLNARFELKKVDSLMKQPSTWYRVKGSPGKRIIIVEAKNLATKYSLQDNINFQYRLYEEDNHIELQYGKIDVLDWSKLREDTNRFPPITGNTYPSIANNFYYPCFDWREVRTGWVVDTNNTWEHISFSEGERFDNPDLPSGFYIKRKPPLGTTFIFNEGVINRTSEIIKNDLEPVVFPNPNNGTFQLKNIASNNKIEIYDLSGKKIQQIENYQLNNNIQLAKGCYILKVTTSKKVFTEQIISK